MLYEDIYNDVLSYVNQTNFKLAMGINEDILIRFLAQGEYNLNYLMETSRKKFVLRINTASQLKLDNQIAYEYQALKLLERSGVIPKVLYLDDSKKIIPYGLLVMEYLPGRPLDYRYDLEKAAETFARVHSLQPNAGEADFLVKVPGPFTGIYNEATDLLNKYFSCPEADPKVKELLEKVLMKATDKKKEEEYLLREPWLAVINTEVNSHNFIVNKEKNTCHLIDWEKPIYGEPAQDIAMFLIRTTTIWKANYLLSDREEKFFIKEYLKQLPFSQYKNSLEDRVESFKFFSYLRAIAWCAMAWTEYNKPGRLLVNNDTYEKITMYIEPDFIKASFNEIGF
ncbi:MAG: aminoglycoside phosphotransferase family protein [Eubacteriales bacterium]